MSTDGQNIDYYRVLQVHPEAEAEVISRVYRYLAMKYHPDKAPMHLKADHEQMMKSLNVAHEVLSDPQKRKDYDALRPADAISSTGLPGRFEIVVALVKAAKAGGGKGECYLR